MSFRCGRTVPCPHAVSLPRLHGPFSPSALRTFPLAPHLPARPDRHGFDPDMERSKSAQLNAECSQLMELAGQALYAAPGDGRDRVCPAR